ncbi:GTPase Era [Thermoflavifilum thermophilum]|uniref:GTPase Era n=1 Tax=Thermoflavifilum thermophilum TaxID=1393122 RepID=A0A1I7NLY7_9BACT|nr:GTPase Era [Thermoflavifilum thermophilum]SFV35656.1 GTP-binding protein Era [Thermoflavifilum thermophilum]
MFRSGFVSIIGRPNVGKSTLMNRFVGEKISIVTPKAQTTRHRIAGILSSENYQIVFIDTPGILDPAYKLQEKMMEAMHKAVQDADVVLYLTDITESPDEVKSRISSLQLQVPCMLAINKIDLLKSAAGEDKEQTVESFLQAYQAFPAVVKILPISAQEGWGLDQLLAALIEYLPEGQPYYPTDELTDKPMRFIVAEIIREKIFLLTREEIPYHTAVVIQSYEDKETLTRIRAEIIVSRESQKGIILGEKGRMIREIGRLAREEIEQMIGRKVFLELFVKVRPGWRENDRFLSSFGYTP